MVGKISTVSGSAITVESRENGSNTFTISSSTTITLDGQTVQADLLAAGQFVVVGSADGTTATAIDAHTQLGPPGGDGPNGAPPRQDQ